ncbi:MAG: hypothetical protein SW019_16055 [Actinomycetota bacterium]|nr:hypothetical protein [Actinomycetota bacterium]
MGRRQGWAAVFVAAAAGVLGQVAAPAVSSAQEPVCPAGMYWDVITNQCLYYDVNVYLDPLHPIAGPVGPVGVGGVVGPVGPGPVGPGPVGPGPMGPGPAGPGGPGRR